MLARLKKKQRDYDTKSIITEGKNREMEVSKI